ncbi:MAG: hypothetical protein NVS3B3_19580 [Aquirhabdus sp.]
MSNPIGARKSASFKAISTAPSFNKTPVGSATPPLPYPTAQDLGNSVSVVPTVKFNSNPVYVLNKTTQPKGRGDDPGVAKGVKSSTVTGEVKPVKGSSTVRVGGQPVIRDKDPNTMNGGNNPGIYTTTQVPSTNAPKHAANNSNPTAKTETPLEKGFLDRAIDSVKSSGQHYKNTISESLHGFASEAMDKGGTITAVGGGTTAVGGAMVLTGVGAVPGAFIAAGGGAIAAVGGGVSTVGGMVESAASGLDAAAEFATSGKLPNMVGIATAYAERMVMSKLDKVTKFIPGFKGEVSAVKAEANAAKSEVNAGKNAAKNESKNAKKDAKKESKKTDAQPPGDGTKIVGSGGDGGRCKLKPYKEGCPSGTPHHVVPDHCFKQPGDNGVYYPGAIKHADGLCICVEGATKSTGVSGNSVKKGKRSMADHFQTLAQHGQIHVLMDAAEAALGAIGNPKGTTSIGNLEKAGASAAAKVTGCNEKDLEKQLRDFHQSKGLDSNAKLRADPFGKITSLDSGIMGKPAQGTGGSGRS